MPSKLYFFDGLRPGTYQLTRLDANVSPGAVPGEKPGGPTDPFRDFTYSLDGPQRAALSAVVTPGSVTYLGRVDVIEASYRDERHFHLLTRDSDQPKRIAHLKRDSLAAVVALRSLREAARRSLWEERLNALPDSALCAAPRDTAWALP